MAELNVAQTYATALYEAAVELDKTEIIHNQAKELIELLNGENDLKKFLSYPGIAADEKKSVIGQIFEGRICTELLNFLYILADKRRIGQLENIVKAYEVVKDREEGYSTGVIYSVVPLGEERISELEEQTSKLMKMNVRLKNELDSRLIGGFKIMIDGKVIDASIRRRFDRLAGQIKAS